MQAEVRAAEKEQQISMQKLTQQMNQEKFQTDQELQSRSGDIKVMEEEVNNRLEKKELMQEQRLLTDNIIENRMINYVSHVLNKSTTRIDMTTVGGSGNVKDPVTQMINQVWATANEDLSTESKK